MPSLKDIYGSVAGFFKSIFAIFASLKIQSPKQKEEAVNPPIIVPKEKEISAEKTETGEELNSRLSDILIDAHELGKTNTKWPILDEIITKLTNIEKEIELQTKPEQEQIAKWQKSLEATFDERSNFAKDFQMKYSLLDIAKGKADSLRENITSLKDDFSKIKATSPKSLDTALDTAIEKQLEIAGTRNKLEVILKKRDGITNRLHTLDPTRKLPAWTIPPEKLAEKKLEL